MLDDSSPVHDNKNKNNLTTCGLNLLIMNVVIFNVTLHRMREVRQAFTDCFKASKDPFLS